MAQIELIIRMLASVMGVAVGFTMFLRTPFVEIKVLGCVMALLSVLLTLSDFKKS